MSVKDTKGVAFVIDISQVLATPSPKKGLHFHVSDQSWWVHALRQNGKGEKGEAGFMQGDLQQL